MTDSPEIASLPSDRERAVPGLLAARGTSVDEVLQWIGSVCPDCGEPRRIVGLNIGPYPHDTYDVVTRCTACEKLGYCSRAVAKGETLVRDSR